MNRTKIFTIVRDINKGRTFMRSQLPQTVRNKKLWDELRSEIKEGYSIDLPVQKSPEQDHRA